ncbi:hypothetical protein Tco_1393869 [Tanacetum coccineum]
MVFIYFKPTRTIIGESRKSHATHVGGFFCADGEDDERMTVFKQPYDSGSLRLCTVPSPNATFRPEDVGGGLVWWLGDGGVGCGGTAAGEEGGNASGVDGREFWCTVMASDLNPPIDSSKARPYREFIIKFTVKNGQNPLTLDYKTFCESTGLDYNNGQYVDHPSTKVVKAELAKIATNEALVQKTPVLKTSFPVAWRILLTFVVQVLGGNYLSTEQLNLIQQLLVFSLLTWTNIDIGEIIFSNLVTRLMAKSREKYVSYPRFVLGALERKGRKVSDCGSTQTQVTGPEAFEALLQKKKKSKTQNTPFVRFKESPGQGFPAQSVGSSKQCISFPPWLVFSLPKVSKRQHCHPTKSLFVLAQQVSSYCEYLCIHSDVLRQDLRINA